MPLAKVTPDHHKQTNVQHQNHFMVVLRTVPSEHCCRMYPQPFSLRCWETVSTLQVQKGAKPDRRMGNQVSKVSSYTVSAAADRILPCCTAALGNRRAGTWSSCPSLMYPLLRTVADRFDFTYKLWPALTAVPSGTSRRAPTFFLGTSICTDVPIVGYLGVDGGGQM